MQVLKFGGTSVANAKNIKSVIAIVQQALQKDKTVVVISALSGTTDKLIEAAKIASSGNEEYKEKLSVIETTHIGVIKELLPVANQSAVLSRVKKMCNDLEGICEGMFLLKELSKQALDNVVSYGELLSSVIVSAYANALTIAHQWVDAREIIITDSGYGNAGVDFNCTNRIIAKYVEENPCRLYIVPGFIASNKEHITTTLGRGGSDYTAAIIAGALKASVLEIWTDVDGLMTADPRLVSHARVIDSLSYQEAMELSHFGAKVIYPPTLHPILAEKIPLLIKNTFAPAQKGTLIKSYVPSDENITRGLSCISKVAVLNLEGSSMIGVPGIARRLFDALSKEKINVILITQASSEHSICIAVDEANAEKAREAVNVEFSEQIAKSLISPVDIEFNLSVIALVGDNMRLHSGISGKMFGALGRNGINVRAIAQGSSERNISLVVSNRDAKKALNVLHEEFFESMQKQVNVFIVGTGNVGGQLFQKLQQQHEYLSEKLRLQVRVTGIANSKKMLLNEEGINLVDWKKQLDNSEKMDSQNFLEYIFSKNLRNSVFVDVTADNNVAVLYEALLKKSVSVVACNKIACSSAYSKYVTLKKLANEFNASFMFETNVGAGLPIISTLGNLMASGDKVNKIEAVLSGTLNYIFNHYNATQPFVNIVKEAQAKGYAEPDPRLDLSCGDVMRKLLILSREAGYEMEMDDITASLFLPEECMQGDIDSFYKKLLQHEEYFKNLYCEAADKNCKLKVIAKLENGKASVSLQQVDSRHDFNNLHDKDNIVLFYTNYYNQQPLVIKGAGAGAEVTGAGIFADIIKTARI